MLNIYPLAHWKKSKHKCYHIISRISIISHKLCNASLTLNNYHLKFDNKTVIYTRKRHIRIYRYKYAETVSLSTGTFSLVTRDIFTLEMNICTLEIQKFWSREVLSIINTRSVYLYSNYTSQTLSILCTLVYSYRYHIECMRYTYVVTVKRTMK